MHRQIVYGDAIPQSTDILSSEVNALLGLGLLAQDILGIGTLVGGLACTPTGPASMNVQMGPGRIYFFTVVDESTYSDLSADTVDALVKQGILLQPVTLGCAAPTTPGFSVNYLIEAAYDDVDAVNTVLAYYNASNPQDPWSGPGDSGTPQPTQRQGQISLIAKPGIAAATGTQSTPSADSGYVGLYVVTIAFGQTIIVSGNIAILAGAPFISETLTQKIGQATGDARYLQIAAAATTYATIVALAAGVAAAEAFATSAASAAQSNAETFASGAASAAQSNAEAFSSNASNLTAGSIPVARVPVGAVTQWEASLVISGGQITSAVGRANALLLSNGNYVSFNWAGQSGTPSYLFGSNDGANVFVWSPANFSVANSALLNGAPLSAAATASSVAQRDASGYLWAAYFNQSSANNENPSVSQVVVTNGTDGFFRKMGLGSFQAQLTLSSIGGFVNAASQLSGTVPNAHLPNIGSMPGVTIAADPGTAPSGSAGQIFFYY